MALSFLAFLTLHFPVVVVAPNSVFWFSILVTQDFLPQFRHLLWHTLGTDRSYNPCESCGHKTCWFSKLDVLGLHLGLLSGAGLKSWRCLVYSNPLLLRKKLWVLSLFLTVRVGFLARLWPSFLYPLCCGPSLICQMHRNAQFLGLFQRNLFHM